MTVTRRSLLVGFGAALAAPAIVRAESLMKLYVPPKPKFVTVMDLSGPGADKAVMALYTYAGEPVGTWTYHDDGKISIQIDPKRHIHPIMSTRRLDQPTAFVTMATFAVTMFPDGARPPARVIDGVSRGI